MPDVVHPERFLEARSQPLGGRFLFRGQLLLATQPRQSRGATPGGVGVTLHLHERDRPVGERPVAITDRVGRVLPALVEQAATRTALVFDETIAIAVAVLIQPVEERPSRWATADRPARRRPSNARTRPAASATAASHRPCRSTASAGSHRSAPARPRAARAGSCPARRRASHRPRSPAGGRGSDSVERAICGRTHSSCRLVISESRPNRQLNHGTPAAT